MEQSAVEQLVSKLFNPEVPLNEDIYNAIEEAKEMERQQSLKMPTYNLDELANKANGYLCYDSKKEHKALAFDDGYRVGFQKALELLTFKSE